MNGPSIAAYNARCWAEGKPDAEVRDLIVRKEAIVYRTRDWQEVGNATYDHSSIDTLNAVLVERRSL